MYQKRLIHEKKENSNFKILSKLQESENDMLQLSLQCFLSFGFLFLFLL